MGSELKVIQTIEHQPWVGRDELFETALCDNQSAEPARFDARGVTTTSGPARGMIFAHMFCIP